MEIKYVLLLFITFFIRYICAKSRYVSLSDIMRRSSYNASERPPKTSRKSHIDPVKVTVGVEIKEIRFITEQETHYFSVLAEVNQIWTDDRLIFPEDAVNDYLIARSETNKVWIPDLAFACEKEFLSNSPERFIQIFYNGTIHSNIRIHLKILPIIEDFSTTAVHLLLVSVRSTTEDVILNWDDVLPLRIPAGMRLGSHLSDPLTLEDFKHGSCDSKGLAVLSEAKSGNYSCLYLKGKTAVRRNARTFVYIPTALCVVLSWVSFWMDKECFLGRFTVPCLALLLLLNQKVSILNEILIIQDVVQTDAWIYACIVFVTLAFIEVVIVSVVYGSSTDRYRNFCQDASKIYVLRERKEDTESIQEEKEEERGITEKGSLLRRLLACFPPTAADAINVISRCLFPLAFLIYVVTYTVTI